MIHHSPHNLRNLLSQALFALAFLGSFCILEPTWAQHRGLRLVPLPAYSAPTTPHARTQQSAQETILQLPFWDDFSQPTFTELGYPIPDTLKWRSEEQNTRVSTGLPINPPTTGVASLDGSRLDGAPYTNAENDDVSDSLVSHCINLGAVPLNERASVYFSFFWQQSGNGEFPDAGDSLRLQFLNNQQRWETVWLRDGGDSLSTDEFTQELIPVTDPQYFHEQFRFRFQAYSRLTGAFDTWNIDYVYLNKNRSAANNAYLDRALTTPPSSPFGDYTALPMEQFRLDPGAYLTSPTVGFYNLNVNLQPVRFSAVLRDTLSQQRVVLNDSTALSPVPVGLERRTITAAPVSTDRLDLSAESLYLETEFSIIAGDTVFQEVIDYRVNDTTRAVYALDDYFAYDDGGAEFGVEINQQGGKVAYQFVAPSQALLTHIDIHFPRLSQNDRTPIRLFVWRDLADTAGQEIALRELNTSAISSTTYNGFTSYELLVDSIPFYVNVQDTFYIGYEQQSEQFVAVGFDKNTDSGDRMYFNVDGNWQQNRDLVGSLMMRPRFDRDLADYLTDIPADPDPLTADSALKVFPNPTEGIFWVEGPVEHLLVMDLFGHLIAEEARPGYRNQLDLSSLSPGLYLIKATVKGRLTTHKILIR